MNSEFNQKFKRYFSQRTIFMHFVRVFECFRFLIYLFIIRLSISYINNIFGFFIWKDLDAESKVMDLLTSIIFLLIFFNKSIKNIKVKGIINDFIVYKNLTFSGLILSMIFNVLVAMLSLVPILNQYISNWLVTSKEYTEGTNAMLFLINTVIFVPIIEEIVFRKFLYNDVNRYFKRNLAIIFTSLMFAIMHYSNIIWGITAFLFSVVLCMLYDRYGFKGTIFFHVGFNSLILINYIINKVLSDFIFKDYVFIAIHILYFILSVIYICFYYINYLHKRRQYV